MLARIGGGNSGIVYYLETGQKQGRELGRDDLDYRVCLDGNIEQLDQVIDSIADKGQERYLHISLSFHENQIDNEVLKAVCDEYKTLLMNAYDSDEYCFYAEAHIPKVKNIVDEKTGVLIERKPHIHIVIPEKNLVTGNKLNPTGMVEHYVKNLDAIQEHINNKFNLASPKDGVRVSDQNHANVLSRMKGDLFSESKAELKKNLLDNLEKKNIRTEDDFLKHLSGFGDVKIYNQGKGNQYYGVKPPKDSKFIRLKSPLFSKQFIETRTIPLIRPTAKQIEKDVNDWCNKTSYEIKHIHPAGEKLRKTYAKLNDADKTAMLSSVRSDYNERYNLRREEKELSGQLRGRRDTQRGAVNHSGRTQSRSAPQRLPHLQERHLVYELRGFAKQSGGQSESVLSAHERGIAEYRQQKQQYSDRGMRRVQDHGGRGRITNPVQQVLNDIENKPTNADLVLMRDIRKNIEPERFLSYCVSKYNIDPELHKVTFANDNSPRFQAGKLNLNASDFLTKHLGLSWQDAKIDLLTVNESQQKNEPYLSVLSRTPLNREQAEERTRSRENAKKALNSIYREAKRESELEYRKLVSELKYIKNPQKREVEKGFLMFTKMKQDESINLIMREKRNVVNAIHNHWKPGDKLQQELLIMALKPKNEKVNMIMNADTDFSVTKSVSQKKQFNQYQEDLKNGVKLTDLVANKKDKEIQYLNQKTKEIVFKDTGKCLEAKAVISKQEAAMMLEYAEKKYGGALRLSGSEAFKETLAQVAAEKGMKIILTPDKYHDMMIKHAETLSQDKQNPQPVPEVNVVQSDSRTVRAEQQPDIPVVQEMPQPENTATVDKQRNEQSSIQEEQPELPGKLQERDAKETPKIDGRDFNKLIIVPVHKNDGFEQKTEFKVAFKQDDKMVIQLKDLTETDLNRMGIDTKNIDMRKVDPVSINVSTLKSQDVVSPLKHAEKELVHHVDIMKSKEWPRTEFDALKEQRTKLEANVEKARQQHAPEQNQQSEHKKAHEQNKGHSI
ncbi:LPD7 domain-containing protein [Morganella morganii]|uniref:LPD7 domain-containing protein n=1 Tax=Morganella morganii TaxID=582 RepID=UPI0004683F5F|nr:LPD7 domain-containing protein [Morganella morganii]